MIRGESVLGGVDFISGWDAESEEEAGCEVGGRMSRVVLKIAGEVVDLSPGSTGDGRRLRHAWRKAAAEISGDGLARRVGGC